MSQDPSIRVLVIEDNLGDAALVADALERAGPPGIELKHVVTLKEGLELLRTQPPDVLVLDLFLPDSTGLDGLHQVRKVAPRIAIVVYTGLEDEETGGQAVRQGAQDYLIKGRAGSRLVRRSIQYALERKKIENQLEELNQTLEQRVAERTAELEHAMTALGEEFDARIEIERSVRQTEERRLAQLQALAIELTRAESRERHRLAKVLHDDLQQILYSARVSASLLDRQLAGHKERELLAGLDAALASAIKVTQSMTQELRPGVLVEQGLMGALRWLASWMGDRVGLHVAVIVEQAAEPECEEVKLFAFEAVRELLFNVVAHARVDRAMVRVTSPDYQRLWVTVEDRGAGFDVSQALGGEGPESELGLSDIRQRLEAMGGSLDLQSTPGAGTKASIVVPLKVARQGAA